MPTVHDAAAYIVEKQGRLSFSRLHQLAYYGQAWSLVWDGKALFQARIEAWASGPIVPALWSRHRGKHWLTEWPAGDAGRLGTDQRDSLDAVVDFYGPRDGQWIGDLVRSEAPWKNARRGIGAMERGHREISRADLQAYYASIYRPSRGVADETLSR